MRKPESWVTAMVVRTIAAVSSLIRANTTVRSGRKNRARVKTKRRGPRPCAPSVCTICTVTSFIRARTGRAVSRVMARASRAVAVSGGGVEA